LIFHSLVVEDSPLGVQGGVATGMTVFGYAELINEERLLNAGAHYIVNNMGNLAQEILAFKR